jgi:copper chaperone CopZ
MPEFTLRIEGMHCGACVRRVSQALAGTDGLRVKEVRVGAARIVSDQDPLPVDRALAALAKAGYPANLDPNDESSSSRTGD